MKTDNWLHTTRCIFQNCLLIIVVSSLVVFGCHSTEIGSNDVSSLAGKKVADVDSAKFTLAYKETKQVKIGDQTYSFSFNQINILFTEGVIGENKEGFTIRTTKVSLGVDGAVATLMANGKLDEQDHRLPATWSQLMNAADYVADTNTLLIGITDVYKSPSSTTYEDSNILIDVTVKTKVQP